jgi:hypothetical protein
MYRAGFKMDPRKTMLAIKESQQYYQQLINTQNMQSQMQK